MAWAAIDPGGSGSPDGTPDQRMLAIGAAKAENELCLQIPGCNIGKDGIWRVPLTWPAYVAFRTVWSTQPVTSSFPLQEWAAAAWEDVKERYRVRGQLDADPAYRHEIEEVEGIWQSEFEERGGHALRPAQRGGVQWMVQFERCGLEDPTGGGKMVQGIRAMQLARLRARTGPVLVICPGSAIFQWRDRISQWAPELTVRTVTGTALRRRQALQAVREDTESCPFHGRHTQPTRETDDRSSEIATQDTQKESSTRQQCTCSVAVIGWPNVRNHTRLSNYPGQRFVKCDDHGGVTGRSVAQCEVHEKELNGVPFDIVIADEAHRMGDARSKQTRAVWWLAHHARYFWPATGTLIRSTISDVWPLSHGMDPRGFPSRSRFLDLFAVKQANWHGGDEILGIRPDTEAAFHSIIQPMWRRIPKEISRPDDPPRLEPEFRYPEMSPAQSRLYKELAKELLAELDGQELVPDNSAVRFGRLCQLAGSSIELSDGEDADGFTKQMVSLALPSSKADDLLEFLGDNPGQLVVALNSPKLADLCEQKLAAAKIPSAKIIGGMSDSAKYQAAQWFQEGQVRVIFINAAGSEAIDLFAASTILFLQPDPSWRSREQKIGRVDRTGQTEPVRIVHSLSRGTVDMRLHALGDEKEERAAAVSRDADLMRWIVRGDDTDD